MKEKKSILFSRITLILIYLIPLLSWIFRIPESMRINMGEFRDDPAKYALTAEMIEKEILHYQIIFYTIIVILILAFVRFVVLLSKNKKLDLFSLALLVVGILYLSTFDYSLFSFPEYTKAVFSSFIVRSDDNSLHFLSILLLGGVFLLSPILFCVYKVLNPFIFKAFKINKKNLKIFKIVTSIIIYILFYLLFIHFIDPHMGKYLGDPTVYVMNEARISESLAVLRSHIYIIIIILFVALIRLVWVLKNKQIDIFSFILVIWGIWKIATYDTSMYTLPIMDTYNYGMMIVRYQRYYDNVIEIITMFNLILYGFAFLLYRFIEKKMEKWVFKNKSTV